jgi:hypothetical protein
MGQSGPLRWPTWIGVVVNDLESQRRFWSDVLGVIEDHSGPTSCRSRSGRAGSSS